MIDQKSINERVKPLMETFTDELDGEISETVKLKNNDDDRKGKAILSLVPTGDDLLFGKDYGRGCGDEGLENLLVQTVVEAYVLGVHNALFPNEPMPLNSPTYINLKDAVEIAICEARDPDFKYC